MFSCFGAFVRPFVSRNALGTTLEKRELAATASVW